VYRATKMHLSPIEARRARTSFGMVSMLWTDIASFVPCSGAMEYCGFPRSAVLYGRFWPPLHISLRQVRSPFQHLADHVERPLNTCSIPKIAASRGTPSLKRNRNPLLTGKIGVLRVSMDGKGLASSAIPFAPRVSKFCIEIEDDEPGLSPPPEGPLL